VTFRSRLCIFPLWPTLFIRLVMTFITNLYALLSSDPSNLAELGTLQGSFPSQLARKILTLAFSCACPGVHRQKECPRNDRGSRNQKWLRRHLASADECRRGAEEVQKHVQPHNSQSVGVSSLTASVSNSRAGLLQIRGLDTWLPTWLAWWVRPWLCLARSQSFVPSWRFIFLLPSFNLLLSSFSYTLMIRS